MNSSSKPVIGIITNGSMRQEFVTSLLQARELGAEIIIHPSGPYLDCARNYVVEKWRNEFPECEWLIFIDDDIEFNYKDILRLTSNSSRPVVGGIYMNPYPYGLCPVVFKWTYDARPNIQADSFVPYTLKELLDQSRDEYGLIQVAGIGTGCLAIHNSVPDLMMAPNPDNNNEPYFTYPMPWFAETTINGVHQGEDLTFCARLNVLGIPVCVDPTVRVGHVKMFKFHPDHVDDFIVNERWIRDHLIEKEWINTEREENNANV